MFIEHEHEDERCQNCFVKLTCQHQTLGLPRLCERHPMTKNCISENFKTVKLRMISKAITFEKQEQELSLRCSLPHTIFIADFQPVIQTFTGFQSHFLEEEKTHFLSGPFPLEIPLKRWPLLLVMSI